MNSKKTTLPLLILSLLVLTGCNPISSQSSSSLSQSTSSPSSTSSNHSSSQSSSTTKSGATSSGTGSTNSSGQSDSRNGVFQFYAINDFHGSILENNSGYYYEGGLSRVGGFLKARKDADPDHTFIISSGDMWQGSLESNSNYGACITEAMNYIGFDSMTLGNHEFDYGQSYIEQNEAAANFPFLAGNIMKWNGGATSTPWSKSQISTVVERGGLKVGIIGMIGEGETTSITSKNVSDITFVNPENLVENEALRLRNEVGCSIVVLSIHDDYSSVYGSWSKSNSLKTYLDGVFCAHTHRVQNYLTDDGVPLLQAACNGEDVSHFELTVTNGSVTCTQNEVLAADTTWSENAGIQNIENKYIGTTDFIAKSTASCGNLVGSFTSSTIADASCKAIYEKYHGTYPNLVLAMENSQRASVPSGKLTYSTLYKATPFTNNIVIMKALGKEIINEASYGQHTYTGDTTSYGTLDSNTYYTIAVIDYVAYHQSVNKQYNYFPDLNTHPEDVLAEFNTYPVDVTFDYFKTLGGTINASSFTGSGYNIYA